CTGELLARAQAVADLALARTEVVAAVAKPIEIGAFVDHARIGRPQAPVRRVRDQGSLRRSQPATPAGISEIPVGRQARIEFADAYRYAPGDGPGDIAEAVRDQEILCRHARALGDGHSFVC